MHSSTLNEFRPQNFRIISGKAGCDMDPDKISNWALEIRNESGIVPTLWKGDLSL